MKKNFLVLLFWTKSLFILGQNSNSESRIIDSLYFEDQKWRGLIRQINNKENDTISKEFVLRKIQQTDSLNYQNIRRIFYEIGYPNIRKVGEISSHNFWTLVQHADKYPFFQDSVLTIMKVELREGNVQHNDYAYLVDRVKVNLGQKQIYGTQMTINVSQDSYEPLPVVEPENLDDRRREMNLPPMKYYINAMNERYFGTLKKH
jgi:hypothetical protein